MYEMKSLEDDWKAYKKRKRKPFLLFGLMLLVSIGALFTLEDKKISLERITQYIQEIKIFTKETLHIEKENISENIVSIKGLKTLDTNARAGNTQTSSDILVDIPILDMENNRIVEKQESKKIPQINIIGTSSAIAYEDVEKRFEQNHDIDDALFLAKSYYKKGNYEKAAYWALETNKLDDDVEESIFIFVESKVKSGQVNEGILILKRYIKQSSSAEAQKLLFRIENN